MLFTNDLKHGSPVARLTAVLAAGLLAFAFNSATLADAADAGIHPPQDTPYPGTIMLSVDATDVAQGIFRAREIIPVRSGELTLFYPKWLPAAHSASGPIDRFAGLTITAKDKSLTWTRYPYDVYAFRVDVPAGVSQINLDFQYLTTRSPGRGWFKGTDMTDKMLRLDWNKMLLYPAGHYSRDIRFQASARLPVGWQFGTALEVQSEAGGMIKFKPTTLNTLVDSPMLAGKYFKRLDLNPGAKAPVHVDMVGDEPVDLAISDKQLEDLRALVTQAHRLFNSHHYAHYDFLASFSNYLGDKGNEHHQSSEVGTRRANFFQRWSEGNAPRTLFTHEYTHSWNGKFRRPAGMWTPSFNVPKDDSLVWVYEGLTQYWGTVLTARSGMWTRAQYHALFDRNLAALYARGRPGFSWRSLQDTTNEPNIAGRGAKPYTSWQMGSEYYDAGQLLWLAVDCKIRALTHDKKSLDNFARVFFGMDNGSVVTRTYTFDDLVAGLNAVVHYDWAKFLRARLDAHRPPLGGIEASGWKLAFTDQPSAVQNYDATEPTDNFTYSIGLNIASKGSLGPKGGTIIDVLWNGPAFKAGVGTGETVVAVNGHAYTAGVMKAAITAAKGGTAPIKLLLKYRGAYHTVPIGYHGGLQYPHLVRIPGTPDYLDQIIAPLK